MTKKLFAVLMALLMCFGVFAVAAHAEDPTEPEIPEEPAYTPVEYKIEDIIAQLEEGNDVFLMPTDIINLPIPAQEEPSEDPAAAEETDPADPVEDPNAVSSVLIVEYLPGKDAASETKGITKFLDFRSTGYAVRGFGESTDFIISNGLQTSGTSSAIDYVHAKEYAFKSWRVDSAYSGKEFNRVVLTAQWDVPAYHGWQGFKTMMSNYMKTFIDYVVAYITDLMQRIGAFFI